jgi:hypothetical protein
MSTTPEETRQCLIHHLQVPCTACAAVHANSRPCNEGGPVHTTGINSDDFDFCPRCGAPVSEKGRAAAKLELSREDFIKALEDLRASDTMRGSLWEDIGLAIGLVETLLPTPRALADYDQLMKIQKGLLNCHNFIVGWRGGWSDGTDDDQYWRVTREDFGPADAELRVLLRAAKPPRPNQHYTL